MDARKILFLNIHLGRYFPYRVHPLSVREIRSPELHQLEIAPPEPPNGYEIIRLLKFGGFPEPYQKASEKFSNNWQRLRMQQLIREDIREISQIQDFAELEYLMTLIADQSGQLLGMNSLASLLHVAETTVARWIKTQVVSYALSSENPEHPSFRRKSSTSS